MTLGQKSNASCCHVWTPALRPQGRRPGPERSQICPRCVHCTPARNQTPVSLTRTRPRTSRGVTWAPRGRSETPGAGGGEAQQRSAGSEAPPRLQPPGPRERASERRRPGPRPPGPRPPTRSPRPARRHAAPEDTRPAPAPAGRADPARTPRAAPRPAQNDVKTKIRNISTWKVKSWELSTPAFYVDSQDTAAVPEKGG